MYSFLIPEAEKHQKVPYEHFRCCENKISPKNRDTPLCIKFLMPEIFRDSKRSFTNLFFEKKSFRYIFRNNLSIVYRYFAPDRWVPPILSCSQLVFHETLFPHRTEFLLGRISFVPGFPVGVKFSKHQNVARTKMLRYCETKFFDQNRDTPSIFA